MRLRPRCRDLLAQANAVAGRSTVVAGGNCLVADPPATEEECKMRVAHPQLALLTMGGRDDLNEQMSTHR